mgnify:CR=1 FL=1
MTTVIYNLEGYLNRDVALFHRGDSATFKVSAAAAAAGWSGGTFMKWVDDGSGEPTLGIADGRYCGFAAFGSDEPGDRFTAMTGQNPHYRYAALYFGGNFLATRTYEKYTYASRHSGPLVPLSYHAQQFLYVSENGKLTPEDESDVAVNASGEFPDGSPITERFLFFGLCAVPPSSKTNGYVYVQTNVGV